MSKVRTSLLLSLGQNYFSVGIQFFASVIVARLLTPAEIGIYSVAMVLVGFAQTLRDFGVTSYIIQEKELTVEKIRSAFTLTLASAWIMAIALGLGSAYAAAFYREPGIKSVMLVLSLNFFLIPFGSVPIAYMQRNMDFLHPSLIKILSNLAGAIATVALAFAGFSYHSMAWGSVAGIVVTVLLVQVWRPKDLPVLPGFNELRSVISFGLLSNAAMLLIDAMRGAPDMIIGRLSGMAMVGFFGRAMGLIMIFERLVMSSLWNVSLPHFAQQLRSGVSLKEQFLHSTSYVTGIAWPFFVVLGFLANPAIVVIYGEKWVSSVSLLQLLCISSLITAPFLLWGSMLTAIGQMRQNVLLLAIHTPMIIALIYMASPYGLKAIGIAFIIISIVDNAISILQCRFTVNVSFTDIIGALPKSAGVALASGTFPALLYATHGVLYESLWLQLLLGITGSLVGWIAGIYIFRHPLKKEIWHLLESVKKFLSMESHGI